MTTIDGSLRNDYPQSPHLTRESMPQPQPAAPQRKVQMPTRQQAQPQQKPKQSVSEELKKLQQRAEPKQSKAISFRTFLITSVIPFFLLMAGFMVWVSTDIAMANIMLPVIVFPSLIVFNLITSIFLGRREHSKLAILVLLGIFWIPIVVSLLVLFILMMYSIAT